MEGRSKLSVIEPRSAYDHVSAATSSLQGIAAFPSGNQHELTVATALVLEHNQAFFEALHGVLASLSKDWREHRNLRAPFAPPDAAYGQLETCAYHLSLILLGKDIPVLKPVEIDAEALK